MWRFHHSWRHGFMVMAMFCTLGMDTGCGTWSGNPPDKDKDDPADPAVPTVGTVALSVHGSGAALALANKAVPVMGKDGSQAGTLVFTSAKLALDEIKLKTDSSDQEEREQFKGPFVVDLMTDEVSPSLSSIQIPAGEYRDIQLKIHKLQVEDVSSIDPDDPLVDHSIYITGEYTPLGGQTVNVTIAVELSEEISLAKPNQKDTGIIVQAGAESSVIIAFRMDRWFDFTGLEYDFADAPAGDITISNDGEEVAKKLQDLVKENIKTSANYGEDEDKNGRLEKDEDDVTDNDDEDE